MLVCKGLSFESNVHLIDDEKVDQKGVHIFSLPTSVFAHVINTEDFAIFCFCTNG